MNSPLAALIRNDLVLQFRNGIHYAFAFVLAIYVGALVFLAPYIPPWALGVMIYSDPSVLGFFFLGALLMLEKSEGTRLALAITPMPATAYFWSKALTLTALALLGAALIALFSQTQTNWFIYLGAVMLTSLAFIGLGFPVALKFRTVTGYLMGASGVLLPVLLPMFLALVDPLPLWAMLYPPAAQLRLILVGLGAHDATLPELAILFGVSLLASILFIHLALRALAKEFSSQ